MDKPSTKIVNDYTHFYAYSWHVDEESVDETFIRVYGWTEAKRKTFASRKTGFRQFVWVELPSFIDWSLSHNVDPVVRYFEQTWPQRWGCSLTMYRKLCGANLKQSRSKWRICPLKQFPFLQCSSMSLKMVEFSAADGFENAAAIYGLGFHYISSSWDGPLSGVAVCGPGSTLRTAGWIQFKGFEILARAVKFSQSCPEFMVDLSDKNWGKPSTMICRSDKTTVPRPLILSFDLEVNSEEVVTMPKATKPGDVVFQISCIFNRLGGVENEVERYLLSLGNPTEQIVGATILRYSTEKKLLMGFRDLVNEKNPNVITGYNIFNFDIPYLMDRTVYKSIFVEWVQQGFAKNRPGIPREIRWSSSAYKNQEFKYLDCEGRLYIDLLPVVQRDFKLNDYKLKTVSTFFIGETIGETKDDLDPTSIFRCYREGTRDDSPKASHFMSICGKYCMQDSMPVYKLFEKLNVWYGLSEMAVVCNVPMITLFTKGQQIKVYSQLYKYCLAAKIIPEKDGYIVAENERYVGAHVFTPKPGLYENVIPLDFSSLYPSLMIAYNIDYSTCAFDASIPDQLCHIMEWEDHIGCAHDPKVVEKERLTQLINTLKNKEEVSRMRKERSEITKSLSKNVMCEKRKYRFLKSTTEDGRFKGVLPTIVQNMLDARKETRAEMGRLKKRLGTAVGEEATHLQTQIAILNQRQLAYKVSANSMYGITGVKAGMLRLCPSHVHHLYGAHKYCPRRAAVADEYQGELVYGDTDSNYVSFNHKNMSMSELWDYAIRVADEISQQFPPPIKLEFEEAIYSKFLILTKKRYLYQTALRDGTIKKEIGKRGVVLNRRDNSGFIRKIYQNMVDSIFNHVAGEGRDLKSVVLDVVTADICALFNHQFPVDDFVITKSTGNYGDLQPENFVNEKGVPRAMLGQYNVPCLTSQVREEERIETEEQEQNWYLDKLPAHIQLLEKIRRRGQMKNEGGRLEYVIVETNSLKGKQSTKIETLPYYTKNRGILKLDYLYYLHRCINPLDQILKVVFDLGRFRQASVQGAGGQEEGDAGIGRVV
uniref:DNA-directed DNA polymerase n=2 Tax=Invertebrate iridescent virus 3 TaxID=345201 RepID=Q8JJZ6_IIV3|nr:delta DNA polymerase [Iridovirus RMIV (IV22) regular R]